MDCPNGKITVILKCTQDFPFPDLSVLSYMSLIKPLLCQLLSLLCTILLFLMESWNTTTDLFELDIIQSQHKVLISTNIHFATMKTYEPDYDWSSQSIKN